MGKGSGNDIDGLFRSLGGDSGTYRELAREADAREAQARWPMLDEIAPVAGSPTQALDASSKRHWRERDEAPGKVRIAAPQPSEDGRRLMGGLDHLLRRGDSPGSEVPDDPVSHRLDVGSSRPSPPTLAARRREAEAPPVRKDAPGRRTAGGKPGLFGSLGRGSKAADGSRDTSLSGVFSRLEGEGRGPKRLGPGRLRKR